MPENTPPGVNIGDPISATDDEDGEDNDDIEFGDTLTYSLGGDGRGQVRHRRLDRTAHHQGSAGREWRPVTASYTVEVTVKDSSGNSPDPQTVTITVTDVARGSGRARRADGGVDGFG